MSNNVTIIKPQRGSRRLRLNELWEYRELVWMMMLRDVKVRYKQTVLGVAWAVIQPVTTMVIFTLIFGRLANIPSDGLPYPVFVFSGLIAWTFFSSAVSAGGTSMIGAAGMISKVYFPRMVVPIASIGVSVIDFAVSFCILIIIMVIYSIAPGWQVVFFPFFALGLAAAAIGASAWLTAITVVYRDFRYVLPFMMQIWMYVTPVIYPVSFIPEKWRWIIYFNPVLGWIDGIRSSILGRPIDWSAVGVSAVCTLALLFFGLKYFERSERRFADVI